MRKTLAALMLLTPLVISASADRHAIPEATPVGKAESCIPLRQINQSHVRSDQVIDFEMTGGRVYRNTLPYACPSLGFEERFAYSTSLNVLCSTDIITVLYSSPIQSGASCGLGQFQPVTLAKPHR